MHHGVRQTMSMRSRELVTDPQEALLEALEGKHLSRLCRLFRQSGLAVDAPLNTEGEAAAHIAVDRCGSMLDVGFLGVLRCVLRLGADPNARRLGGQTLAHRCAEFDLELGLAQLAEFGGDTDLEDDEGYAPVHVAATLGHARALEWLCSKGCAHVERLHSSGATLSFLAVRGGHLEALRVLARLGADLRRPCYVNHELVRGRRVEQTLMGAALYEGYEIISDWLSDEQGIGKDESELVVVDPSYIASREAAFRRDEAVHCDRVAALRATQHTRHDAFPHSPQKAQLWDPTPSVH
mmetsp:Transcript_25113/g.75384  ORF Transcript_25113/g.75384 Transcript_25113/m.75384 type:complete len:295 (-) Transcript_25113:262-1146(-)